ncbi:glycoside hydrolase family 18 protein [Nemania sp. FL0916]|nr:glycoside hydrolase family 18 protein [Nemania sp. FL0916]
MHIARSLAATCIGGGIATASSRFAMYYDQWHTASPQKGSTAGITHVVTAFADPTLFNSDPPGQYTPFVDPKALRANFDDGTKMCLAVGGWGQSEGFSAGQKTEQSRALFAKNVAAALDAHGYDCVDIDWEYPGGNGEDYKRNPNSGKVDEIDNYPLFLKAVKNAIGNKELSIAVPGLERDMIAFTPEKVPAINEAVDVVNVMAYDLMNRRDNTTKHHTSVNGALASVQKYIDLGMTPAKLNLGFAFYAKYFTTAAACGADQLPTGCELAVLEDAASGNDTGKSGAKTFMEGVPVLSSGKPDDKEGGEWFFDTASMYFWTWDTPAYIGKKFETIVKAKGLGGVMAWSLGEDSADYTYIKAIQAGLKTL